MRRGALALAACGVLAPTIVLAQSAQDKADAEVLFNAGKSALAAGNFADACPKLAESQRKDPAIGTALYLAECYERSGKIASAWAEFKQAGDMANQRHDSRVTIANQRADRLTPSKLTIVLASGADVPGLEIKRDGETVARAQLGLASAIDGGKHAIVATAPNKRAFEWSGDVAESRGVVTVTIPKLEDATASVTIAPTATTIAPPPSATIAPPPPTATSTVLAPPADTARSGLGGGKIAGIAVGAAGAIAMGLSPVFGAIAQSNFNATSSAPDSCVAAGCPTQKGVDDRNAAKSLADVGTGLFIGGAVALVAGVVLFIVSPNGRARVSASGRGALFEARF